MLRSLLRRGSASLVFSIALLAAGCADDEGVGGGGEGGSSAETTSSSAVTTSVSSSSSSAGGGGTGVGGAGGGVGQGGDGTGGSGGADPTGGGPFAALDPCGDFTDDFDDFDVTDTVWEGPGVSTLGTGDLCVNADPEGDYAGIYTEDYRDITECFVSVGIEEFGAASTTQLLVASIDQDDNQVDGQVMIFFEEGTVSAWIEDTGQPGQVIESFSPGAVTGMRIRFDDAVYFDIERPSGWWNFAQTPLPVWADIGKFEIGAADGQGDDANVCFDDFNLDAP